MMKKIIALAITLMMVSGLAGCSQSAPADQAANNAEPVAYTGEGQGIHGLIKVEVLVNGQKIEKIDILEHSETAGISDPAFEQVPKSIIEEQSLAVDTASGATMSSKGIISAVGAALAEAGVDLGSRKIK